MMIDGVIAYAPQVDVPYLGRQWIAKRLPTLVGSDEDYPIFRLFCQIVHLVRPNPFQSSAYGERMMYEYYVHDLD
jgi:hypothetical protein